MEIYIAIYEHRYDGILDYSLFSTEELAQQWLDETYGEPSEVDKLRVEKETVDSFPPIWYERYP